MSQSPKQNTEEYSPDDYKSSEEFKSQRIKIMDNIINYHSMELTHGRPKPSKYIPYQKVYDEFRKQHHRAINRLRKLKDLLIKEEEGE